ncbi:hypothetical protein RSOLAG1IB_05979 [Rhizoctonia solani AG-1 IB]|uniref:Uncharacterized protein n=1 Tax=Thanatephorus cucumeris (strain AG1-IB / isolate 7/3/14) TaxID=1108050 RepID=A0A0B7F4B7_THACB|nr:hypothetical protein RSOLAG1IB_05979 [Rhizoctonia solani AG-1 IB]
MITLPESPAENTLSSPSMSLADFDYDSESPVEPLKYRHAGPQHTDESPSPFPEDRTRLSTATHHSSAATKEDITSLRLFIQREFEQLKTQKSPTPAHPPVEVPKEAFTDALRAELAVQLSKITVLEEETRKLRSEKQELRTALDRAENLPGLQAELNTANQELKRVYVERQGLWDERSALWKERNDLWKERADLWSERQSLWDERGKLWNERDDLGTLRDELMAKVQALESRESE